MSDKTYSLSDSAIAQVAKVLQVAILTGTDITDNLRLMRFVEEEGTLILQKEYEETFHENLDRMLSEIPVAPSQKEEE